jgi:hypothetical protein
LAILAVQIAASGGDGVGQATGQKVKQRFFLDGINMPSTGFPVYQSLQLSIQVDADPTISPLTFRQLALSGTEHTLDHGRNHSIPWKKTSWKKQWKRNQ